MLLIGELINATRKNIKKAIIGKDSSFLQQLALEQERTGADYIDINVATGVGKQENEIDDMIWAIKTIRKVTNRPLAIDTTDYEVLKAGLDVHGPGAMINSISAEKGRLLPFIKIAKKHDCLAIVLPVDTNGIPKNAKARMQISEKILNTAQKEGLPTDSLYFDPLVMPLGVEGKNGVEALNTIRAFKKELGVKTAMGLSNISYGLPLRRLLNRTFLTLAIYEGLDSVIINTLDKAVMSSLRATVLSLGNDYYCSNYLEFFRQKLLID